MHAPSAERCAPGTAQVVATRKALQHAQAELHLIGEELAQARREVSLTKREQVRPALCAEVDTRGPQCEPDASPPAVAGDATVGHFALSPGMRRLLCATRCQERRSDRWSEPGPLLLPSLLLQPVQLIMRTLCVVHVMP